MLIEHTAAFCYDCRHSHKADLVIKDNQIMAVVHCPKVDHCDEVAMIFDYSKPLPESLLANRHKEGL